MKLKRCGWIGVVAAGMFGAAGEAFGATTDEVVLYGLTNRSIAGATVVADDETRMLHVGGLSDYGYKGVSVRLGEADGGLYFSPHTRAAIEDGYFMSGLAYGKVGPVNLLLSTVICRRKEWATFPMRFDFSLLGAIRKTVFAYAGDVVLAAETFTDGEVVVSSSNSDNLGPRVNPFWRAPDGSFGVLVEFVNSPPLTLPSGRTVYASRFYVRADNPLVVPEHVSRVDIFGGGGLPEFTALDERLGMFGRPHRALGAATFDAKDGRLTVNGCNDAGTDGVMIELQHASAFHTRLRPVSLQATGALLQVSASSAPDRYSYYSPPAYLGSLTVENQGGEKQMRFGGLGELVEFVRVEAFHDSRPAGTAIVNPSDVGILGTNDCRIISAGVNGSTRSNSAGLLLGFAAPVAVRFGDVSLSGDQFLISLDHPTNDVASFTSFQLLACGTPLTITGETASAPPALELGIRHAGTNVLVSWPAYAMNFMSLKEAPDVGARSEEWRYSYSNLRPVSGSRVESAIPMIGEPNRYFRLVNYLVP